MTNAYDKSYLEKARISLGRMMDFAVYDLGYNLEEFWDIFLSSNISKQFECGDVSILAGKSGIELALMVTKKDQDYPKPTFTENKSEEYWLGWALAYYQWDTCLSFSQITSFITINEILAMYTPYHEIDIRQFCDQMTEIYTKRKSETNLKLRRISAGLSQSQLAKITNIPVRTIQQYEQRQKKINKASAEYLISLSCALYCDPQLLLEVEESASND